MRCIARKLARYLFTGGAAAVVDIGGFAALSSVHMPLILAAVCSFGVATTVNFFLRLAGSSAPEQRPRDMLLF